MSMNKKYLFVIPRLGGGGAERVMVTIANQLCKNNEIRIATLTAPGSYYRLDDRVEIVCLDCPVDRGSKIKLLWTELTGMFKARNRLKKYILQWNPDAVLSFLNDTNLIVLSLRIFSGIKTRIVVSERADPSKRNGTMQYLERHWYPKADVIVCQSNPVTKFFNDSGRRKATVIFNPISSEAIPEPFEGKRRATIVGVGRLMAQKNFALLINSFARIAKEYPDYTLEIYGNGVQEEMLSNQIKKLGLENRVFLMGMKENVMHHIADSTMFVLPSDFEGFPNALIEAMATGLPVITTDFSPAGVAAEIVKKENGIIVPVNDEVALAKAMEVMILDEKLRVQMGRKNREILEILGEELIAEKWENVLDGKSGAAMNNENMTVWMGGGKSSQ